MGHGRGTKLLIDGEKLVKKWERTIRWKDGREGIR